MENKLSKAILDDFTKKFDNALREFAEEMSFQIESRYEACIQAFYEDYSPTFYRRTYSTYEASDHWNDFFQYETVGDIFESGIRVSPDNISGKPYRADTDWVFNRTFKKGIHGIDNKDIMRQAMDAARLDYMFNDKKLTHGKYKGKKIKNWKTVQNIVNQGMYEIGKKAPEAMHPAPKVIMDKSFKKLTTKMNMDKMFNKILSDTFNS